MGRSIDFEMVDPIVADILRQKTPAERLAIAVGMRKSVAKMQEAYLRSQHPEWTDEQVRQEIVRRIPRGDR